MANTKISAAETISMLFVLDREDDPRLYDDLIRFKKGTKRINRLRLLAHEGERCLAGETNVGMRRPLLVESNRDQAVEPSLFDAPGAADVFAAPISD
ncbi:MAG: hypothetical protein LBE62_08900 [Azonexus sp.]|jgi:hypothetical protein|nr:hypothetical protein [Azonexus sp.]